MAASAPAGASVAGLRAFPSTHSNIHRFVGIQGQSGHSFSGSELTAIASTADIVVGLEQQLKHYGPKLRTVNPHIRLFVYFNGMFAQSDEGSKFPRGWYLRDARGQKVRSRSHHNYLMNPYSKKRYAGRRGWARYVAHQCASKVKAVGFATGCYLDQTSSAGNTKFVTALPINPRTGRRFGMATYMKAVNRVIDRAASRTRVIGNSYESGPRYYGNHTRLVNRSNGAAFEAEHWMGATQPRDAQTLSKWKRDVQMLIDSQASGHGALVRFGDMSSNLSRWESFVTASMLLGNNGHVWLQFESSSDSGPQPWQIDDALMNAPLGKPLVTAHRTDGYRKGGVYRRRFSNGIVLVNPSGSSVTVNLPSAMRTLGGSSVRSVRLVPYSGTVLLN